MELLVEGQSLRELSKSKEPNLDRIIELAIQTSDGLGAAHDKKFLYRDLKIDRRFLFTRAEIV
jgi:serine/threonine protein kinase